MVAVCWVCEDIEKVIVNRILLKGAVDYVSFDLHSFPWFYDATTRVWESYPANSVCI